MSLKSQILQDVIAGALTSGNKTLLETAYDQAMNTFAVG